MKNRDRLSTLILTLIVGLCAGEDWPAFRGGLQRTGNSAEHAQGNYISREWRFGPVGAIVSSPTVADGILYLGSRDSMVYAINAETGALLWKKRTYGWVDASPLISGDTLIIGSRDNRIYVLNRHTGDSLGEWEAGLQLASPAVMPGGGLLTIAGPPFNALREFRTGDQESKWSLFFTQPVYSTPALSDGKAVFGGNDGTLYGVNLTDHRIVWTLPTEGTVYLSTPAIANGTVYFAPGDFDRRVYAVNLADGTLLWKSAGSPALFKARSDAAARVSPSYMGELRRMSPLQRQKWLEYYRRQNAGFAKLFSLGKKTEAQAAGFVPADNTIRTSSVAVDSGKVYVIQRELGYTNDPAMAPVSRFTLLALDKTTGTEIWRFTDYRNSVFLGYNASPVVVGDKVFFGWGEGKTYVLDNRTGNLLSEDSLQGHVISSPAVSSGKIFYATMDGYVYAGRFSETPPVTGFQDGTYAYPNPAKTVSQIQYFPEKAGEVEIRIYDTAERLVKHFTRFGLPARVKAQFDWDVSLAANGVYFALVKITYADKTSDKKIIKIAVLRGLK